ncbi:iron transporter [Thiohalobacter sp. IOR34]|uniref:iron transporter n=1 Tax=Thiohalobacter sp. IOR34 TaxID=3057176 RepID=UPI0025B20E5D|nr:iron transporter [Thiohalobacter sp. IOR34]WJW75809.1 iron transporter [Thiohalobacter sp. IOR34]
MHLIRSLLTSLLLGASTAVSAGDVRIGSVEKNGMQVGAVYIQPVTMEPMLPGMAQPADIHLEADIHALRDNPQGFREGDWIPYLSISYTISKQGSDWTRSGILMPMAANDGPHYASNLKLDGAGKYRLRYHIKPPPYAAFHRHSDRETGVAPWWAPFDLEWDFIYVGVGKKGGY